MPSDRCLFTGPWTVTRSSLRMLRRVTAFCRPLRPVLLLVSVPRLRSPVVGVPGLCGTWRGVPFARQRRPGVGLLGIVLVVGAPFLNPPPPPHQLVGGGWQGPSPRRGIQTLLIRTPQGTKLPSNSQTKTLFSDIAVGAFHEKKQTLRTRDVLEGGWTGGSEGGGGEGGLAGTPLLLWAPPKAGQKIVKSQSSWHQRHRSKISAVSLKH